MSPSTTPSHTPFNQTPNPVESQPAAMGPIRHGTPWRFSSYHSQINSDHPARQMGDYVPAFPGAPPQANSFVFDASQTYGGPAADAYAFHAGSHPDPSQIPLPSTSDIDLHHGPTVAGSIGYASTSKIAGSRRTKIPADGNGASSSKAKGKRKRVESSSSSGSDSDDASDGPPAKKTAHGGRRAGAGNYGEAELKQLLRLTQKELPVGQNGWKRIHEKYSAWAGKHGHSPRDAKALEAKFKMLVKTKKPTGSGKRPEMITRAKAIDKLINEKVGTRNLNDSEIDNDEDEDGYTSDLDKDTKKHVVIARSDKTEVSTIRRTRGNQTADLAHKLASSLDPEAQRLRDEDRANRSLQNTQIFTLSQQLRDANGTIESLRSELSAVRERLHKVERIRDRLDTELNFERRMAGFQAQKRGFPTHSRKYNPELTRVKGKIRHDEFFPEGGQASTWISDGSSASDWEENKENFPEFPFIQSPGITYKPQHMKYKVERSPTKLPSPPSSSPFVVKISSATPLHPSTSTAGPSTLFTASASPQKPSFS